jgi:DNA recombination protein RmuC
MALMLAIAATVFSLIAALFAVLTFFRSARREPEQAVPALADTVRTEADRTRLAADEQARGTRQELTEAMRSLQDSLGQKLENGIDRLQLPVTTIGKKLDEDMARMAEEAGRNRDLLRQSIESKLDMASVRNEESAKGLREELTGHFGVTTRLLSETMIGFGDNQHQRLNEMKLQIGEMAEKQTATGEALRQTVEARLDVLRQENSAKLDEMRQTVDEKLQTTLEKRLTESFNLVQTQLENVHKGLGEMQSLAVGVGDLKRVLTNVKARGTWAEVQLGILLEQFLSPEQFVRNAQIKPHSSERVEYAIKFSGRDGEDEVLLPIDAKFPTEDYERLVRAGEAADPIAAEEAASNLETRVKSFAKSMSEKYINPPVSTDFAILYLPTESLYAEILRRPGVCEQFQRDFRVVLAGPTTLSALLSAFQMGFRSQAIQKRSTEVWKILGAVRTEFSEHGKVVSKLQRQLGAATNTIEALGTRTRAMNRKLKDVEVLPATDAQEVLGLSGAVLAAAEENEESEEAAE